MQRTVRAMKPGLCAETLGRRVVGARVFRKRCARWGVVLRVGGQDSHVAETGRAVARYCVPLVHALGWPRVEAPVIPAARATCATQAPRVTGDFAARVAWMDNRVVRADCARDHRRVWAETVAFRRAAISTSHAVQETTATAFIVVWRARAVSCVAREDSCAALGPCVARDYRALEGSAKIPVAQTDNPVARAARATWDLLAAQGDVRQGWLRAGRWARCVARETCATQGSPAARGSAGWVEWPVDLQVKCVAQATRVGRD